MYEPIKSFSNASEKQCADLVNVEVRLDNHPPLGNHINVESVIDLRGPLEGRQRRITNNHVEFKVDTNYLG